MKNLFRKVSRVFKKIRNPYYPHTETAYKYTFPDRIEYRNNKDGKTIKVEKNTVLTFVEKFAIFLYMMNNGESTMTGKPTLEDKRSVYVPWGV